MTTEVFEDQDVPPGVWVNIHEALGLPTGTTLIYQNNGGVTFRAVTAVSAPAETENIFGINVPTGGLLFEAKPMSTESLWVRGVSGSKVGKVGVLPPSITPMQTSGPPLDYEHELAMGRIPGMSRVLKFGRRDVLPAVTGTFATLWDGAADTYVPPTEPRIHDIASDNIADAGTLISSGTITTTAVDKIIDENATFQTDGVVIGDSVINDSDCSIAAVGVISVDSETELTVFQMLFPETGLSNGANNIGDNYRVVRAASTGAALTYIQGTDENRLLANEFVINNGTTNVPTVKLYRRQFRMRAFAGGSAKEVVGLLTSTAQVDGTVTAQINNGTNQTLMAIQSIPINKRGSMKRWRASLTKKQAGFSEVILRVGLLDGINYVSRNEGLNSLGTSSWEKDLGGFILPPGVDVWMQMDSDGPNIGGSGGFDIVLEDI